MGKVFKAPEKWTKEKGQKTLFLAGSIEMGKATDWQTKLTKEFDNNKDIVILNPRRDDWDSSWKESIENKQFKEQVVWELDAQEQADLICMYFDKETKSPITLLELGLFHTKPMVICCPDGYWKKGNVEVVCERHNIPLVTDFDEFVGEIKKKLNMNKEAIKKISGNEPLSRMFLNDSDFTNWLNENNISSNFNGKIGTGNILPKRNQGFSGGDTIGTWEKEKRYISNVPTPVIVAKIFDPTGIIKGYTVAIKKTALDPVDATEPEGGNSLDDLGDIGDLGGGEGGGLGDLGGGGLGGGLGEGGLGGLDEMAEGMDNEYYEALKVTRTPDLQRQIENDDEGDLDYSRLA